MPEGVRIWLDAKKSIDGETRMPSEHKEVTGNVLYSHAGSHYRHGPLLAHADFQEDLPSSLRVPSMFNKV